MRAITTLAKEAGVDMLRNLLLEGSSLACGQQEPQRQPPHSHHPGGQPQTSLHKSRSSSHNLIRIIPTHIHQIVMMMMMMIGLLLLLLLLAPHAG